MNPTATLEAVGAWPVADRLELLFRLWDQIVESGWRPTPSRERLAELDRRLAAYDADPSPGLTWDEVAAHVRRVK